MTILIGIPDKKPSIHSKNKGNTYEVKIAKEYREQLGFRTVQTCRNAGNRLLDAQKVDLVNTGIFNVQCKAQEKMGLPNHILAQMPKEGINVIHRKIDGRKSEVNETVTLSKDDFYILLKGYLKS